jgi:hypothetical protein
VVDWSLVAEAVFMHRVHVLLAPHATKLGMPDELADHISRAQRQILEGGIAQVRDTSVVSEMLEAAGVEHLIVKGVVLAAAMEDLPALRGRGDIDLWVRAEDVGKVESIARSAGWRRRPIAARLPEPDSSWRWRTLLRFAHEQALDHPERATLDLHWRLAECQAELGFDFDDAYERSIPMPAAGPSVRTLSLEDTFVHIAQHGRKEAWATLRHLVDVIRLVDVFGPDRSRELSRKHQNVALAILTAANLEPSLAELAGAANERTQSLAEEAWKGCLSLEFPQQIRRSLTGQQAWRARWRYESWLIRSAPDWPTRAALAAQLAVPLRPLVDPDPPFVSVPRAAVQSVTRSPRH